MRVPTVHIDVPGFGDIDLNAFALDQAIMRHLPASPADLTREIEERSGVRPPAGTPVVVLLAILADFDCNVDGHPLAYAEVTP